MIYFIELMHFYQHDISKMLKHPLKFDRLINMTLKKQ